MTVGITAVIVITGIRHRRTGRWLPTWEEWKAGWAADRQSPGFWLFYAAFFGVFLAVALIAAQSTGWKVFEAVVLGAFMIVGCVQHVRSRKLRARGAS